MITSKCYATFPRRCRNKTSGVTLNCQTGMKIDNSRRSISTLGGGAEK